MVLLFTLVLAVGTGIVFGLAPALGAARPNVNQSRSKRVAGGSSGSAKDRKLRDLLVIGNLYGLALALLVGAQD